MVEERTQRRLAAILAADVVGYSGLMEQDEAGTMTALAERRKAVWEPLLAKYRGRIVRLMGDGTLAEFASAVDAVQCAVDVQRAMKEASRKLSDDRAIVLRIGLNLGDVIVEGDDLYGDGVNVAARLEGMADPGGICLSAAIHQQVERLLPFAFKDLGDQALKNIARPVRVYSVDLGDGTEEIQPTGRQTKKPSIAVLPFTNISSDPEQQYLSDGITEDIITELSRYRELQVIARNSSFQYRDKSMDMKRIGRELGVEYLVEGSLRKVGDRLRITAQLIEADTGSHVWANRYDRRLEEVFAIQDEVTQTIAATLVGLLGRSGAERARRKPTDNWAAYDFLLQATQCINQYDTIRAESLLKQAIKIDPDYAHAHATLSHAYATRFFEDVRWETITEALACAQKALALDGTDYLCHAMVGFVLTYFEQFDVAEMHLDKAVELNPNSIEANGSRANLLARVGRTREALDIVDLLMKRDPLVPDAYWELRSIILFQEMRYEEVVRSTSHKNPLQHWDHAYLAAAYARLGREQEARTEAAEVLRMKPDFSILAYAKQDPFKNPADLKHLLDAFRAAGLPE